MLKKVLERFNDVMKCTELKAEMSISWKDSEAVAMAGAIW